MTVAVASDFSALRTGAPEARFRAAAWYGKLLFDMPNIIIYTTPACVYCKMAKAFFKEKGIAYMEKDVASDEYALREMMEKSGQLGVPVIDVDGKIMVGFARAQLAELVGVK